MPKAPEERKREPTKGSMTPGDPRNAANRSRYLAEGGPERLKKEFEARGLPVPDWIDRPPAPPAKEPEPDPEPVPVDDPEDELAAMKRVLAGTATQTPLDAAFVEALFKDPTKFIARKRELEAPPAEPGEVVTSPSLPPLVRDGETPCPLCGQPTYPEDQTEARLLAETQLNAIPDKLAEWPKLKARIAELEAELKDNHCASCDGSAPECWKSKREEVPSGPA